MNKHEGGAQGPEKESRRWRPVEINISDNPEINENFNVLLDEVMADRGNITLCRQEGDRFPGPRSVIVDCVGWHLYLEFDTDNKISSARLSVDTGKKIVLPGGYTKPLDSPIAGDIHKKYKELRDNNHGEADIQNEINVAEAMLKIEELVK